MVKIKTEYIAAGGNRHPAAADWDAESGLIAFGADRNIALWKPSVCTPTLEKTDVDFATFPDSNIFASGSADSTVKIWRLQNADEGKTNVALEQTVKLVPRFFPLALALASLTASRSLVLAVAGTASIIQVFVKAHAQGQDTFGLQATLTGHEGWIRSLSFVQQIGHEHHDILLASASQDKYIRLWRIRQGEDLPAVNAAGQYPVIATLGRTLSNKVHRLKADSVVYSITFEALLLGHEDWIYTTSWRTHETQLQLLSASADNSLAIWQCDPASGVWICTTRLGEISAQKGSTTATGSTGGFWLGLWSSEGQVVALGRTGGFRLWTYAKEQDRWLQDVAASGHVKEVTGLSWSKDGGYLLSTSSDQTTRLHAEWRMGNTRAWYEFARPQIHGYDINCIDTLGESRFVSGADEKLLRVFDQPRAIALLLQKLCAIKGTRKDQMPQAADIPVLGLSNKAIKAVDDHQPTIKVDHEQSDAASPGPESNKSNLNLDKPPFEDHLARYTLWPESEKLYGHGFEISAIAASQDGTLVATACRASTIHHALIRIFETTQWREIKPPLTAHSLTVTRLQFSDDDQYLLSVGRDRQWAVFERSQDQRQIYTLAAANQKGHSRMILDGAWAPTSSGRIFATAGRDKLVKLWQEQGKDFLYKATISASHSVTAVAFLPKLLYDNLYIASGTENGTISLNGFTSAGLATGMAYTFDAR
ncbi:hypothetical protein MMC16_006853 [Acarospora aff. strigata]|nr:hypothetical protein [Acarospora aff. strigata]